jgi:hypothetical protein
MDLLGFTREHQPKGTSSSRHDQYSHVLLFKLFEGGLSVNNGATPVDSPKLDMIVL